LEVTTTDGSSGSAAVVKAHVIGEGQFILADTSIKTVNITGTGNVRFRDNRDVKEREPVAFAEGLHSIEAKTIVFENGFVTPWDGTSKEGGTLTLKGDVYVPRTVGENNNQSPIKFGAGNMGTGNDAKKNSYLTLAMGTTITVRGESETPVPVLTAASELTLSSSGSSTTFTSPSFDITASGNLTLTGAENNDNNIVFDGDVIFGGNLTFGGTAAVTFKGAAFFKPGRFIAMPLTANTITLGEETGRLAITEGDSRASNPNIFWAVLKAAEKDTKLAPAVNTKLTFAAEGKGITQSSSAATPGPHGITVSTGDVVLVSGSTYTVESEGTPAQGTLTLTNVGFIMDDLVLDNKDQSAAPKLILKNTAILAGTGKGVVAGKTTITGNWTATGGTITIEENAIEGGAPEEGATVVAFGGTAGGNGVITVTALQNDPATLEVTNANINISAAGRVILTGHVTPAAATLQLKAGTTPAKLIVSPVTGGGPITHLVSIPLKLVVGDGSPTTAQAEIKADGESITTTDIADKVHIQVTGGGDLSAGNTAPVVELGAGASVDLNIESSTQSLFQTTIINGNVIQSVIKD
jgi:hypothetical protein